MRRCRGSQGTIYAVITGCLYTFLPMLTKYVTSSAFQLIVVITVGQFIFNLPFFVGVKKVRVDGQFIKLLPVLCLCGTALVYLRFLSFKILPLGDASVIAYSSPLFKALVARLLLKEKITKIVVISVLVSTLGLCLTIRLPELLTSNDLGSKFGGSAHLTGCSYALACVVLSAVYSVFPRKLRHIPSFQHVIPFFSVALRLTLGLLVLPIFLSPASLLRLFHVECSSESWLILACCAIRIPIQRFNFMALKFEEAYFVSAVTLSVDIVLSFVWQVTIFGDAVNPYSVVGAVIVFCGGMILPLRKWAMSKPVDSPLRKLFRFVE